MAGLGSWLPRRPVLGGDRTPQLMRRELVAWNLQDFALFIGLDVGKSEHHATALTTTGEKAYDKPLPNDEAKLQDLLGDLTA